MEHARIFLAISLSFLVFLVWGHFFGEQSPSQKGPDTPQTVAVEPAPSSPGAVSSEPLPPAAAIREQDLPEYQPAKDVTVQNKFFQLTISQKGAVVKNLVLLKYREHAAPDSELKRLISSDNQEGSLLVSFGDNSFSQIQQAVFYTHAAQDLIQVQDKAETISFNWTSPAGFTIEKKYTFQPDSYLIDLEVNLRNTSSQTLRNPVSIYLSNMVNPTDAPYGFEGPSALIDQKLVQIPFKEISEKPLSNGNIQWVAQEERYFISSVIPVEASQAQMKLSLQDHLFRTQLVYPDVSLEPGQPSSFRYHVYMGPKSLSVLQSLNLRLDEAIHFGMFDILAKPCLWIMNSLYGVIPNYGIAIIILTLLVKALLWPLGTKSYKSMSEMKRMQPLLADLRAKYANDKKKMNEEIMALYKTYKINPMGGCLPMLVQIPVFFALYRMLYEAIELRHAPFFGWINDLSAPDRLFSFPFSIPFMEPPYGIPVLTLIMGVTMFIQQKMSPPIGDPTQAKMMMLMPVVFTVIFINFSSGLVLYWLINNVVSILQQYFIQKKYS
jgi:YidC/Oxa1 family membrane protein insertase